MAAALTLTTALASAEAVYNSAGKKLYLNRHFLPDENFENRATIEQLMAQLDPLPASEGAAKKKRLIVVLGLIYPSPKKAEEKEKSKEPNTLEEVKKALAEMYKTAAPTEPVHQRTGSLTEIAKQIQKELSILLLACDFLEFEREYYAQSVELNKKFKALQIKEKVPLEDPEIFAMHVSLKFKPVENVLSGEKLSVCVADTISTKTYNKLLSFFDHPHPLVRNFVRKVYLSKKCDLEFEATGIRQKRNSYVDYIGRFLLSNSHHSEILKKVYPELIEFCLAFNSAREQESSKNKVLLTLLRTGEFFERLTKEQTYLKIVQRYKKLFEEFQGIQAKLRSSKKEALAKKFSLRLGDFFLPKTPRKADFPTPDEFLKLVEPKKPSRKTPEPKEKPEDDLVKVSVETLPETDGKEKPSKPENKKPITEASFLRKILQSSQPIVYDERVKDWQIERIETPSGYSPDEALWKHAFTAIVDPFVGTAYSFKDVWKNPKSGNNDFCFCILADITFRSGETVEGVFQYTFDAKGICYHRWFGKMSNIKRLDKAINEKRREISFPPLRKPQKPHVEELGKITFEIDPYFGSITFNDKENGLKIKIYKVED